MSSRHAYRWHHTRAPVEGSGNMRLRPLPGTRGWEQEPVFERARPPGYQELPPRGVVELDPCLSEAAQHIEGLPDHYRRTSAEAVRGQLQLAVGRASVWEIRFLAHALRAHQQEMGEAVLLDLDLNEFDTRGCVYLLVKRASHDRLRAVAWWLLAAQSSAPSTAASGLLFVFPRLEHRPKT